MNSGFGPRQLLPDDVGRWILIASAHNLTELSQSICRTIADGRRHRTSFPLMDAIMESVHIARVSCYCHRADGFRHAVDQFCRNRQIDMRHDWQTTRGGVGIQILLSGIHSNLRLTAGTWLPGSATVSRTGRRHLWFNVRQPCNADLAHFILYLIG